MRLQCDGWAHQMFFVYASDDARLVFDLYSVYRKSDMACGCCDTSKLQWNSKSITVFVYLFIRIFFLSLLVNQKIVYSWPFDSFGSFNWFIFTNTVTFFEQSRVTHTHSYYFLGSKGSLVLFVLFKWTPVVRPEGRASMQWFNGWFYLRVKVTMATKKCSSSNEGSATLFLHMNPN